MAYFHPEAAEERRKRFTKPDTWRWVRGDAERYRKPKPDESRFSSFPTRLAQNIVDLDGKAGFRQDQPRWPRGSGDISGRWSGGAGAAAAESGGSQAGPRRGGHHFVNRALYEKLPLRPETRKVFENAVTGPLNAGPHRGGIEHRIYNKAIEEQFQRFTRENGVRPEDMTPDQARKFLDEVKRSNDPRIRGFNLRIYMREIMYWIRRRYPRGSE